MKKLLLYFGGENGDKRTVTKVVLFVSSVDEQLVEKTNPTTVSIR